MFKVKTKEKRSLLAYDDYRNIVNMVRDWLVCRVRDKRIQHLLGEPELDFKKARDIALAAEAASRGTQATKPSPSSSEK